MAEHPWTSPCLSRSCGNAMLPGRDSFRLGGFLKYIAMSFSQVKGYQRKGGPGDGKFPFKVPPPKKQELFCLVRR